MGYKEVHYFSAMLNFFSTNIKAFHVEFKVSGSIQYRILIEISQTRQNLVRKLINEKFVRSQEIPATVGEVWRKRPDERRRLGNG